MVPQERVSSERSHDFTHGGCACAIAIIFFASKYALAGYNTFRELPFKESIVPNSRGVVMTVQWVGAKQRCAAIPHRRVRASWLPGRPHVHETQSKDGLANLRDARGLCNLVLLALGILVRRSGGGVPYFTQVLSTVC